ncbi:MAG: energy transducer TonB [Acidobacteriota bacterium]|jgi:protein TonB
MDRKTGIVSWILQRASALALSLVLTVALFLVLPVMQAIGNPIRDDMMLRSVGVANLPPPPPPPPEQEPEEPEEVEEPPKLTEEAPPLDLSQLELALNPGFGGGFGGEIAIDLGARLAQATTGEDADQVFSLGQLDQRPRVLFQRPPRYPADLLRSGRQGTVYVLFTVQRDGRVADVEVQRSTDPAFERPAVEAVRQWKFEPGTRNGQAVRFKMRVPITFNAG